MGFLDLFRPVGQTNSDRELEELISRTATSVKKMAAYMTDVLRQDTPRYRGVLLIGTKKQYEEFKSIHNEASGLLKKLTDRYQCNPTIFKQDYVGLHYYQKIEDRIRAIIFIYEETIKRFNCAEKFIKS